MQWQLECYFVLVRALQLIYTKNNHCNMLVDNLRGNITYFTGFWSLSSLEWWSAVSKNWGAMSSLVVLLLCHSQRRWLLSTTTTTTASLFFPFLAMPCFISVLNNRIIVGLLWVQASVTLDSFFERFPTSLFKQIDLSPFTLTHWFVSLYSDRSMSHFTEWSVDLTQYSHIDMFEQQYFRLSIL